MAAWLLCPRQGGNAGQHPFWPRGRVSSLCLSFPMGGAPSPSRSAPGLLAFTRAIFPLQGRSSLMVLGGQFRVLILSAPPNAPPRPPFCPANSYSSGKTQSGLPRTPSPPASASQSHREPRVEPATLLASCVTPARHSPSLNLSFHICKMEIGILPSPASPEI